MGVPVLCHMHNADARECPLVGVGVSAHAPLLDPMSGVACQGGRTGVEWRGALERKTGL